MKPKVIIMPWRRTYTLPLPSVLPLSLREWEWGVGGGGGSSGDKNTHIRVETVAHKMKHLRRAAWDVIHTGASVTTGKSPRRGWRVGGQQG